MMINQRQQEIIALREYIDEIEGLNGMDKVVADSHRIIANLESAKEEDLRWWIQDAQDRRNLPPDSMFFVMFQPVHPSISRQKVINHSDSLLSQSLGNGIFILP